MLWAGGGAVLSLKVVAGNPEAESGEGKADTAVGSRAAAASPVWKLGVLVMCLGVRSPSGGEAGREGGVIHKLGTQRAEVCEQNGEGCRPVLLSAGQLGGGSDRACQGKCTDHKPHFGYTSSEDLQEDLQRFQPWMSVCVCTRGRGC